MKARSNTKEQVVKNPLGRKKPITPVGVGKKGNLRGSRVKRDLMSLSSGVMKESGL